MEIDLFDVVKVEKMGIVGIVVGYNRTKFKYLVAFNYDKPNEKIGEFYGTYLKKVGKVQNGKILAFC